MKKIQSFLKQLVWPATGHLGDGGAHQLKDFGGVGGGIGGVVAQLAIVTGAKREQTSVLWTVSTQLDSPVQLAHTHTHTMWTSSMDRAQLNYM